MKRFGATLAVAAMLAGNASARELEEILEDKGVISDKEAAESKSSRAPKGSPLWLHWDKGLRASSPDGKFKFKIGGRIMNDWAVFDEDDDIGDFFGETDEETGAIIPQEFGSGTEFRRVRFYVEGEVYDRITFKTQYDFAGGEPEFKDVYIGVKKVPLLGHVKVGQFKEPFSLEELTSSKYITFMERALPNELTPSRNTGIGFYNAAAGERVTYGAGFFRGDTDAFGAGFSEDDVYDFTLRLTGLPVYAEEGRRLVHLGFGYSHRMLDDTDFRIRARPEAHLSPVRFVDTGSFTADSVNLIGAEAAAVFGPISVQGEYIPAFSDASGVGDPDLMGYYVFVSYFLTGEHRAYKTADGQFDRVKPAQSFLDGKGGLGAWELGVRHSGLDLSDADVDGGELQDVTAGINWYWNSNVRWMANYVFADLDRVGEANIFQARFQIDF